MIALPQQIRCPGCNALVPDSEGPTHRYVGASAGCWQLYGELLAKEFSEPDYAALHQRTVDTYMVQHPGVDSPQARQSVAVHLMSLCLQLEEGMAPERATRALPHFTHRDYPWLTPPDHRGEVTVQDVLAARTPAEHTERVQQWARSVWHAWAMYHNTVRRWLDLL